MQLANRPGRARQRPHDRVLPPAAADHKYRTLPGAYPLQQRPELEGLVAARADADRATGAPDSSSIALT